MSNKVKFDLYEHVTNLIIEKMESGKIPWAKPWKTTEGGNMPRNAFSKRPYNGINMLLLSCLPYACPLFATFRQIEAAGGKVNKGERSHMVVFWTFIEKKDAQSGTSKKIPFLRYYNVFNLEQTSIEWKPAKVEENTFNPIDRAQNVCDSYLGEESIPLNHKGERACYSPVLDCINMPKREAFATSAHYYATLFHEMGHSTGHESRLKREFGLSFGNEAYSKEELIAELTSAFLCAECAISNDDLITNSAGYLQGWIAKLKEDKRFIFSATSKANAAVRLILKGNDEGEGDTEE